MRPGESETAALPAAAARILGYLAETDPLPPQPCDAIIGFGVFDLELPRFCGELYQRNVAPRIIFTGGIGAGTGDFGGPEADVWRDALLACHPRIPQSALILENRSTNTAENIAFTAELLERSHPDCTFGRGIRSAVIVASPSRLRRVRLTMRRLLPAVHVVRQLPPVRFAAQQALYTRQGLDYFAHLAGELERISTYPARGWIAPEPLPADVLEAWSVLRAGAER
jgi:uncharacterized SAM-binding protein YcdF (DUF218 family)